MILEYFKGLSLKELLWICGGVYLFVFCIFHPMRYRNHKAKIIPWQKVNKVIKKIF